MLLCLDVDKASVAIVLMTNPMMTNTMRSGTPIPVSIFPFSFIMNLPAQLL